MNAPPKQTADPGDARRSGVFGAPPADLVTALEGATQFSPLVPGAAALEAEPPHALAAMTMLAPPGTLERRYAMALALRALSPGSLFAALAPKDKGGSRIAGELRAFGCTVDERSKQHHRICVCETPGAPLGIDEAIKDGAPRFLDALKLWSQPGVFSWNRADPGSALLTEVLPAFAGRGADLGCGAGALSIASLANAGITEMHLIDIDRRAIEAARRNIEDHRARFIWADVRKDHPDLKDLDFIVMNPPFHDGGAEDQSLGKAFVLAAAKMLRKGGALWFVANRHLPYEAMMKPLFKAFKVNVEHGGFKVFEARK